MIDILTKSLFLPNIGTSTDHIGRIFLSFRKILLMYWVEIWCSVELLLPSSWIHQNMIILARTIIFPINETIPYTFNGSFLADLGFDAPRQSVKRFQCGPRWVSWIKFGPASVSSKNMMQYSTDVFSPMRIPTLYVGLTKDRFLKKHCKRLDVSCLWFDVFYSNYFFVLCNWRFWFFLGTQNDCSVLRNTLSGAHVSCVPPSRWAPDSFEVILFGGVRQGAVCRWVSCSNWFRHPFPGFLDRRRWLFCHVFDPCMVGVCCSCRLWASD